MKYFFRTLVAFLSLIWFDAHAQDIIAACDMAQFRMSDDSTVVEVYYSLDPQQLKYEKNPPQSDFLSRVPVQLRAYTPRGMLVKETTWTVTTTSPTATPARNMIVNTSSLTLPRGKFILRLSADVGSRRDSVDLSADVLNFNNNDVVLSDIELASQLAESADRSSPFWKSWYEVIPAPGRLFGERLPVAFYYVELYGIDSARFGENCTLIITVRDKAGSTRFTKEEKKSTASRSTIIAGAVQLGEYESGDYALLVTLLARTGAPLKRVQKNFSVVNPHPRLAADRFSSSEYAVMDEEAVKKAFEESRYLATQAERAQFTSYTTLDEKRRFLYTLWLVRDPNPTTEGNEYKEEYYRRIALATKRYSGMNMPGWKSDRGRVFILYGEPTTIDKQPFSADLKPIEIWNYSSYGNVDFIFVDRRGFGVYELVHSTLVGEPSDPNWMENFARRK